MYYLKYNKIFARLPILRAVFVCFYTLSAHNTCKSVENNGLLFIPSFLAD